MTLPTLKGLKHDDVINQMNDVGYAADDEGICRGIAMMAVQAIVIGQFDMFIKRMLLLKGLKKKK